MTLGPTLYPSPGSTPPSPSSPWNTGHILDSQLVADILSGASAGEPCRCSRKPGSSIDSMLG